METEPRSAKQYKCHHCCSCKNYRVKGMVGGEKCVCVIFWLTRRSRVRGERDRRKTRRKKKKKKEEEKEEEEEAFWGTYSTSNKLLLVARHILTTGLQNRP